MILCVEQDGAMDMFEPNSDLHHVLLVGEAGNPEDLYPFDDVCSCWAAGWRGGLPTENPQKKGLATKCLPQLIDQCADASVKYVTQPGEPAEDDDPPLPVLSLTESLALVDKYADEIKGLFSATRIDDTRTRLRQRRQYLYKKIGLAFDLASVPDELRLGLAAQSVDLK